MSSTHEQGSNMLVPSFTYSPLPQKSYTRMIRLLPDKDEDALIQCELFNYHLSQPGEVHLYEALSYVWGSSIRSRSIILDGYILPVTESLHTALLHLRSKQLERILWIDALSINQDDDDEKSKQIPLMRMIYAQARRVVVWLGESQEYGDRALFQLGLLGRQKKISVRVGGKVREECEKLLQRDWFRRIWVLQEVGVAQSISIMCGTVQINGHNFCEGLDNLEPSSTLMARISPVSFLIRGASFRSYNDYHSTVTLLIGELVSMYRNHKATKQHDKIYALLGLSSDSDSAALVPDYELPWHEVFRRVTQHIFPKCSVEICYGSETAIIKGKGWILGYIYSTSNSLQDSQQTFKVAFNQTCQKLGYHDKWKAEWSLQASGELLQDGDIICLLEGLSQPSVLRLCADYYTVVTPVVRPKQQVQNTADDVTVRENCSAHGLCDIFMGWKVSEPEHVTDGECLSKLTETTPKYSEEHCEAERRLNYTTTIMVDAAMQLSKLGEAGKRALDNILSKGGMKGVDTNFLLSQSDGRVSEDLITAAEVFLWQKHESPYAWQRVLTVAVRDTRPCGFIVTSILLQRLQDKLPVSEEVVKAAAANTGSYGSEIMAQLVTLLGERLPVSEEVVKAAAANTGLYGSDSSKIMAQLVTLLGERLPVSEEVVKAAAANTGLDGPEIMAQLVTLLGERLPVSEEVVKAAAANTGHYGSKKMAQLVTLLGKRLPVSEEVVKAAAANTGFQGPRIMAQLVTLLGERLPVSEEVVKAAA